MSYIQYLRHTTEEVCHRHEFAHRGADINSLKPLPHPIY